jgi:16S rRNA (guanine527-N7)-methyltransferase
MAPSRDPGIGSQITAGDIDSAITAAGLKPLSAQASEQLRAYLHLLLRWNSRLNLTAVREPSDIIHRHLVECIQCAQSLPPASTLLDFGSGAGLPGIPIAIGRSDILVTLGESQGKKAAFLREAVRVLSLPSEVYDGRIENMPRSRVFDVVTLRAVDKMAEACRAAAERIAPGGWLVVFATSKTEPILQQLLEIVWRQRLPTPGLEDGRLLLGQKEDVSRGTS